MCLPVLLHDCVVRIAEIAPPVSEDEAVLMLASKVVVGASVMVVTTVSMTDLRPAFLLAIDYGAKPLPLRSSTYPRPPFGQR